jgi:hypothetical protein
MSPSVLAVTVLLVCGLIAGIMDITKFGNWLKKAISWIVCMLMIIGMAAYVIKIAFTGLLIAFKFLAKLFS